jgi:hypothetical protein
LDLKKVSGVLEDLVWFDELARANPNVCRGAVESGLAIAPLFFGGDSFCRDWSKRPASETPCAEPTEEKSFVSKENWKPKRASGFI